MGRGWPEAYRKAHTRCAAWGSPSTRRTTRRARDTACHPHL